MKSFIRANLYVITLLAGGALLLHVGIIVVQSL